MESILWLPLTDYHCLSPICHVLSRISFAFYITCMLGGGGKDHFNIEYRRGESKFAWLVWKANVTVFLLQSASAKR